MSARAEDKAARAHGRDWILKHLEAKLRPSETWGQAEDLDNIFRKIRFQPRLGRLAG
jgi:hypothetical protein